jgi:predicted deacetylase
VSARYLVRFDDITAGMNWGRWEQVEERLRAHGVKPLLAVVPDNIDPHLEVDERRADFWDRVRAWQADGWAIGIHGYQHDYVNRAGGLLGLNRNSEFATLPRAEQAAKLAAGLAIFADHDVHADAWIAPSHSFDRTTVSVLLEQGVDVISDGFGPRAGTTGDGAVWVPQQLWSFRSRPTGTWTVCLHHNGWSDGDLDRFGTALGEFQDRITDLDAVVADARRTPLRQADRIAAGAQRRALLAKRALATRLGR